jgi:flavodoxin
VPTLQIIYASTSGHTEYVVQTLMDFFKKEAKKLKVTVKQAEKATPEDLLTADMLLLASSTWNTSNVEGQLNPHMFAFLLQRAKDAELKGKKVAIIALGDERYFYTANAAVHLESFVRTHGGQILSVLKIVNEPYGQEEKVKEWGRELLNALS